ncbi:glycosyltransferase family 2 protein [Euzebya tangerina]|uniref:glycosyltransferase family 2 protein n=1 Tax=Euzebya tangerina TaxID=591198 RepID=UPI00196B277F|nr:glycosyltransferase family 2 protein [Euzebya tangerina]
MSRTQTVGTVAITMAGRGSRFRQAGYDRPKYEIEALGAPLFDWSMRSLEVFRLAGWRFCFAARSGVGAAAFIGERADALGIAAIDVLTLDEETDGQATTALLLAELAVAQAPLVIYNIDTFVDPAVLDPPTPEVCGGWIPCFPAPGEGWSFARTNADGDVVELREKVRISDHATIGLYWFDSAARYMAAYESYYEVPDREEKGERYVAPLYNQLIADGAAVRISRLALEDVGMLGTPEQVANFTTDPPAAAVGLARSSRSR